MFGAATLASAVTAAACNTAAYGGPPVPIQVDRAPVVSDAGSDAAFDAALVDASFPYQPEAIVALYGMVPADVDAQAPPPRRVDAGPAPKPKK